MQSGSLDCCSIDQKSQISKIQQMEKAYNLTVSSPNRNLFFVVFKGHYKLTLGGFFSERKVHIVPPIVDLGFLYPKLSKSSTDNIF